MHLYPIDGAAARVPADATAFPYRDGGWAGDIVGVDPDPANVELITHWARDYLDGAAPVRRPAAPTSTSYGRGARTACGRPTGATTTGWRRSRRRYDPENTFHINQNIPPADQP